MFLMITQVDVKILDMNSGFFGVPPETLMENAGRKVAEFVIEKYKPTRVTIFCGMGNNGGDGFVATRYLSKHCRCNVVTIKEPSQIKTELAKKNFERLENVNIVTYDPEDKNTIVRLLKESDVVLDAMLGIGSSGELKEPYRSCVELLNKYRENFILVSVDMPTGIGTSTHLIPDATVTFHDTKEGMNKDKCGEINIVDIGIPKEAEMYVGPGELKFYYPKSRPNSHKGDNGVVMVIGGGPYIGAPVLSALAALRTGADLVYLAVPKRVSDAVYSLFGKENDKMIRREHSFTMLNLIVKELSDRDHVVRKDLELIEELLKKMDAVVIGPGLGRDRETLDTIVDILEICGNRGISCVIDADAITAVKDEIEILKGTKTVITPHRGEFFNLTEERISNNIKKAEEIVKRWAKEINAIIVLKGNEDIISDGKKLKRNRVHHPAMTVGGTGDVLAGVIGTLLSKNIEPFMAGCIGTFVNGYAGMLAFDRYSYGLLATDVIEEIPQVLKKYL